MSRCMYVLLSRAGYSATSGILTDRRQYYYCQALRLDLYIVQDVLKRLVDAVYFYGVCCVTYEYFSAEGAKLSIPANSATCGKACLCGAHRNRRQSRDDEVD